MRTLRGALAAAAVLMLAGASASVARAGDEGFVSIFDGKTLKGWEGKSEFWSVEEGAIVGRTTAENPTKGNTFLIWRDGQLEDFELRLQFQIENHNSGIQYRSKELEDYVVTGYQADIDATKRYLGILYEEKGRGILAERGQDVTLGDDGKKETTSLGPKDAVLEKYQEGGWNEYRIRAVGNHLVHEIDGIVTCEVTDEAAAARARGILALQLHAGPPMVVRFRDLRLRRLP